MSGRFDSLIWKPCAAQSQHGMDDEDRKQDTDIVIGASEYSGNVNHLGVEILLNLSNKEVYIPSLVEWVVAAADQAEELLAIEVTAIPHNGPIILDIHDGGSSSAKYDIDLGQRRRAVRRLRIKWAPSQREPNILCGTCAKLEILGPLNSA